MEKKVEKNGSQVVISFVANGDEWKKAQDKEFNKLSAKLKIDGFRQGHVPASIAKARINPAEVLQDAMFTLVNKEYANVLNEEKLNVIAEPKLNVTKLSETELECRVTVALPPVVTLGDYKGIKVEKVIKEGGDADTNGAVVGAVIGAKYGFYKIPKEFIEYMFDFSWMNRELKSFLSLMKY